MDKTLWLNLNAVLGSLVVTIGLWMLLGTLALPLGVVIALGVAGLLAWKCPSIGHVWIVTTLILGIESLAWPVIQMVDLQKLGPEPPLEDLQRIFTAVMFGLFSGVFWMTFAYGIYKRTKGEPPLPESTNQPATGKKRKKSKRKQ
ncbi:MAG: hypothetical protein NPIRA02_14020 [Nitrospirales bacterium]|nr:MAG: hypothetical protein NPIRA02_14020 [Nitrospirales bacterium]